MLVAGFGLGAAAGEVELGVGYAAGGCDVVLNRRFLFSDGVVVQQV